MNRNIVLLLASILLVIIGIMTLQSDGEQIPGSSLPGENLSPTPDNSVPENNSSDNTTTETEAVVVDNLDIPWGIEFLPDNDMLITERSGTFLRIQGGETGYTETFTVEGVEHRGEGGLLGVTVHPNYTENNWIYLYMTTQEGDMLQNRVVRYELEENQLTNSTVIIDGLPGAIYHDGGRIDFGPDGKLYITAGDATNEEWAQDTDILAGKILRINPDGSIPEDNPFDNEVYSYGHRNPQGLAWVNGQLWATEHGDQQNDELNRIEVGANYGWPEIEGDQSQKGMRQPDIHSSDITWAPAGAAYVNGSIFFAGLRGQTLYEAEIEDGEVINLEEHLEGEYGRLRAVSPGPDGYLYISTSNRDGRGEPETNDDKIIRINPDTLTQ